MPPAIPNFFTNRAPWLNITFGGSFTPRAALTAINGVSTEDKWQKQASKETSGSVAVFQGTTWGDVELTFLGTEDADFDDLRTLWDLLAPKPGQGTGTGTTTTPGQTFAIGSPAKGQAAPTAPTASNFNIPNNEPAKTPSVGPRPPTISVQYPLLAWHGITAVARAKWEGPTPTDTNGLEVKLKLIADKPPTPAGTGAMSPASPGSQYAIGSGGAPGSTPQDGINKNAATGAAGV